MNRHERDEAERNRRVRRTLDSLKCPHPRELRSTDSETGDEFCQDCGDVTKRKQA
jgi:hypothetical protein